MSDGNSKKSKVIYIFMIVVHGNCSLDVVSPQDQFLLTSVSCFVQLSWSKKLVRKWFNIKGKAEEVQANEVVYGIVPCRFEFVIFSIVTILLIGF